MYAAAVVPEFTQPLRKVHAVEGKTARFECAVTGTPVPEIQWYVTCEFCIHI
ncbi:hypothetical protein DPMN_000992 [Dreissena polymorpha]|uniref:Ig-like domain-containing protein n=1 Tax=Dreissena polymorpha TaxID=45954 RepID=A0A9D4MJ79_DREPO|nr:hypothetical protein DPMN_000992 [Dreissena polymorpha]